jgi:hypothetical protein
MTTAQILERLDTIDGAVARPDVNPSLRETERTVDQLRRAVQDLAEIVRELVRRDNER